MMMMMMMIIVAELICEEVADFLLVQSKLEERTLKFPIELTLLPLHCHILLIWYLGSLYFSIVSYCFSLTLVSNWNAIAIEENFRCALFITTIPGLAI